jgi:NAD(P)-dependent dehydrogenase (short-subunit alcohol dehydrogenase family)
VSQDFVGQTALITGSTSGIGRAVAEQLATRGARVIVSGRDITRGDTAVAKIRTTGGRADFLAADLGHIDSVRMLAAAATNLAGHVDVLVNNAGLFPFGPTPQVAVEEFDAVFDVNVRALTFWSPTSHPAWLSAAGAPSSTSRWSPTSAKPGCRYTEQAKPSSSC